MATNIKDIAQYKYEDEQLKCEKYRPSCCELWVCQSSQQIRLAEIPCYTRGDVADYSARTSFQLTQYASLSRNISHYSGHCKQKMLQNSSLSILFSNEKMSSTKSISHSVIALIHFESRLYVFKLNLFLSEILPSNSPDRLDCLLRFICRWNLWFWQHFCYLYSLFSYTNNLIGGYSMVLW